MARISYNKMAKLFQRLATSYKAGLDIRSVVRKEADRGRGAFRQQTSVIADQLDQGQSLAHAMEGTDGYFPDLAVAIVKAGEQGGRLEDAFARLSKHYRDLVEFRTRFLSSIAWPVFQLCAAVVLVGALIWLMHWAMVTIGGAAEPIDWFGMGSTWGNFLLYCAVVFAFFGSIFLVVFGAIKGWYGTLPMRIARRVPLVGKTIEHLALARFAWTMSIAENAGMSATESSELALRSTENYYYTMLIPEVEYDLKSGKSFYGTFDETRAFPEEFLSWIDNGETAGELAETMHRASVDLQSRAETNLQIIGKIGFVLVFGFVALLLGIVIITLYQRLYLQPINDLLDGMNFLLQ